MVGLQTFGEGGKGAGGGGEGRGLEKVPALSLVAPAQLSNL